LTVPVMNFRWGRKGYLASVIFRTFEHVHGMTDLPKPIRHPAARSRDVNAAWAIDTLTGAAAICPSLRALIVLVASARSPFRST
jgi:hypothetical protein